MTRNPAVSGVKAASEKTKDGAEITGPGRILIVDDEVPMRELCRRALTEAGAETASGAEEALVILRRAAFDIILTDIQMSHPRAGVDLTEEARGRWPRTCSGGVIFNDGVNIRPVKPARRMKDVS